MVPACHNNMATTTPARLPSIVDVKAFERLELFKGEDTKFAEFRTDFETACTMVGLDESLDAALTLDETQLVLVNLHAAEKLQRKALYALLMQLCSEGRARLIVRGTTKGAGFVAWGRIVAEYEPDIGNRYTGMLAGLVAPEWEHEIRRGRDFGEVLFEWENAIQRYRESSGKDFTEDLMVALVMRNAPASIRATLAQNAVSIGDNYGKLRTALRTFKLGGTIYDSTGVPKNAGWGPMVGAATSVGGSTVAHSSASWDTKTNLSSLGPSVSQAGGQSDVCGLEHTGKGKKGKKGQRKR